MRPLICDFSNFQSREKTSKTPMCLGGLSNVSKSRRTKGARRQSWQRLKRIAPNLDGKVTHVKKSEFPSFTRMSSLRAVRSYSMDRRDFPFLKYGHQMPRSEQYSFLQDLSNTPPIWPVASAEQRKPDSYCYLVRPHSKCRDWIQFHRSNFPYVIDACIFTCWNENVF